MQQQPQHDLAKKDIVNIIGIYLQILHYVSCFVFCVSVALVCQQFNIFPHDTTQKAHKKKFN